MPKFAKLTDISDKLQKRFAKKDATQPVLGKGNALKAALVAGGTLKKVLLGAAITAGAVALVFGGLTLFRNISRQPVDVFPVMYLAERNWDSSTYTYGEVSSEGIQKVYLGEKQKIIETLVALGDQVHVGDPLLSIDTTLSGLEVKKAEIAMGKAELAVQQAKAELATLMSLRPHSSVLVTPDHDVVYNPHPTPHIILGTGLQGDPFIILWGEGDVLGLTYLGQLIALYKENAALNATLGGTGTGSGAGEGTGSGAGEGGEGDGSDASTTPVADDGALHIALITRQNDALNAPITSRWGVRVTISGNSPAGFAFFAPTLPASVEEYTEIPGPYYEESGSFYTAAELIRLRAEKQQEVTKLEIEYQLARVNFERIQQETNDGFIRATVDGAVTQLISPDEAMQTGAPILTVSAGGGYLVTGTMSEFDLQTVHVGQTVELVVYDWSKGGEQHYTGEIVKISDYPTQNGAYYGGGNPNMSTYPFTVFVDGSANISDASYVEISYGAAEDDSTFYLPNAFIRTEGGNGFVYILGADGKLERRAVALGRDMWGSYTQIKSGLTREDYIAFPYGKDVVPGAKVIQNEDLDKLYQSGGY